MTDLTPKERSVYDYIQASIEKEGFAPSVRDICRALGIRSTSTAHAYLGRLEEKGYIKKGRSKSRAVTLEKPFGSGFSKVVKVPIVGKVPAGTPMLAIENFEGYIDFPTDSSVDEQNLFALTVKGESMVEAGILDGDTVIVSAVPYADNGEIVVAMVDDEATVKKFYKENGHVRLQPCNCTMLPIIVDNVTLLGKVIASFRFYRG